MVHIASAKLCNHSISAFTIILRIISDSASEHIHEIGDSGSCRSCRVGLLVLGVWCEPIAAERALTCPPETQTWAGMSALTLSVDAAPGCKIGIQNETDKQKRTERPCQVCMQSFHVSSVCLKVTSAFLQCLPSSSGWGRCDIVSTYPTSTSMSRWHAARLGHLDSWRNDFSSYNVTVVAFIY